ncbi:MAG: hypothetical protein ACW96X_06830, partial [Promethearchaeota archaeon]
MDSINFNILSTHNLNIIKNIEGLNMSYSENEIINNYLTQVYKKLPEWLKLKKEEISKIFKDLEDQILNEARNIAEGQEPTDADIQQALFHVGPPGNIAKIYKKRGTPILYITEELLDFYLRTMVLFFIIVLFINIIIAVFKFVFQPLIWLDTLGGLITGSWIACLLTAIIITIIFIYFSMEGFLPEDFGVIPKRLALIFPFHISEKGIQETREFTKAKLEEAKQKTKDTIAEAKLRAKEKSAEIKAVTQERLAAADLKREQKLLESKMRREERLKRAKQRREEKREESKIKRKLKKKYPISTGELIFGAIAGIVFGLFIIIQPFAGIPGLFETEFLDWLKLFGLLIFFSGLINIIRLSI